MFLSAITALIAGRGRMQRPASRTDAAAVDKSNSMSIHDTEGDKPTDRDDEPTVIDRRPPVGQLPVYTGEGTISSWVLAEEWSEDAWLSAEVTIPEGLWR